jgi:hypothetical protein
VVFVGAGCEIAVGISMASALSVASRVAHRTIVVLLALSLFTHVAIADPTGQSKIPDDPFGIGIDFTEICDLHAGAPISDKCYGYLGAVIEIVKTDSVMPSRFRTRLKTCIPRGQNIAQIFEKIRPSLRVRVCGGFCTSTGYVMESLYEAYPCKD